MAERIEIKSISTPAGTAKTSPLITPLVWREGHPVRVEIHVPPGPSGLLGVQIAHSGRVIIPRNPAEFLETDDEIVVWPLDGFATSAAYTVHTYNTDVYPHKVQLRVLLDEIGPRRIATVPAAPIVQTVPSRGESLEGQEGE